MGGETSATPILTEFQKMLGMRDGELLKELDVQMRDLVGAVRSTNKTGKITLTLTIEPSKKAQHMLFVTDDVKVTMPKVGKDSSIFFATDENTLSRRDPRQPELRGLREPADVRDFPRDAAAAGYQGGN